MKNLTIILIILTSIFQVGKTQTINVLYPNGGENFINNTWSPHNITWEDTDITSFKIEYSDNNGTDWILIEDNYSIGNYYSWNIPDIESSNCLIRVSEAGGSIYDESDANFTITAQNLFIAEWNTTMGQMRAELRGDFIPMTSQNFMNLAYKGFYTDLIFHRVISGFMIQDGCPLGNGTGGPGYSFDDEFHPELRHNHAGILSMANAGPNTNGSQYFITVEPTAWLDDVHTVFGRIIDGMDVLFAISEVDTDGNDKPIEDVVLSIDIVESVPNLSLTYPFDGIKIEKGREIEISWESDFIADSKIEFSSNNGGSWTVLTDSIPSDNEKFYWIVPDITSTECLIKISSLKNPSDFTQNIIPFEIREKPAELTRFELYEGVTPPDNNTDNIVLLSKNLKFKINIENFADEELNSINASLISHNENISLISESVSFSNIPVGSSDWSNQEFEIQLPGDFPSEGQYSFSLFGTAANIDDEFWLGDFNIPVLKKFPFMTVDDDDIPDSNGNGNHILEPEETIELEPKIDNVSDEILYEVFGQLKSDAYFINIWNEINGIDGLVFDTASYNTGNPINSGSSANAPVHDFVFDYTANEIFFTNLLLQIQGFLNGEEGTSWDNGGIKMKWGIPIELNSTYPPANISELNENEGYFDIIQNPVKDILYIKYDFCNLNQKNIIAEIKDIQGKTIKVEILNILKGTKGINISSLSKGIYFVKVNNLMKKIVKIN